MQYKLDWAAYYYSLGTFVSLSDGPAAFLSTDCPTRFFFLAVFLFAYFTFKRFDRRLSEYRIRLLLFNTARICCVNWDLRASKFKFQLDYFTRFFLSLFLFIKLIIIKNLLLLIFLNSSNSNEFLLYLFVSVTFFWYLNVIYTRIYFTYICGYLLEDLIQILEDTHFSICFKLYYTIVTIVTNLVY